MSEVTTYLVKEYSGSPLHDGRYVNQWGDVRYVKDNELHRLDGPAEEWECGGREWYKDGKRHREDGPAVYNLNPKSIDLWTEDDVWDDWCDNGAEEWYKDGKLHRLDGPAVIKPFTLTQEWWVDGVRYLTAGEYKQAVDIHKMNQAMI